MEKLLTLLLIIENFLSFEPLIPKYTYPVIICQPPYCSTIEWDNQYIYQRVFIIIITYLPLLLFIFISIIVNYIIEYLYYYYNKDNNDNIIFAPGEANGN